MYELIQAGTRTYYIDCPAKMGIYVMDGNKVCMIDSGNDKDAAKKALKILEANGWTLDMVICTHSHADHIGGNRLLQQRTGCRIYMAGIDKAFARFPLLEPSVLFGGRPCRELKNKFLMAQESEVEELTEDVLPQGLEMLRTDGHSISMTAIRTDDDIWFLADCLTSEAIIKKYHVSFLYDVEGYLNTLEVISRLEGKLFIPAHAEPAADIRPLAAVNRAKAEEIIELLLDLCREPMSTDDLIQGVFCTTG
ncbi:MBL fold metallo-hydrolase [Clostridium sp. AM58-1XD]|uniref:MBL fold metallo-hydrolase n=1 Tax=Clostridium sp. AM58-1XD TaxID=2292307 RepID=UPI0026B0648E